RIAEPSGEAEPRLLRRGEGTARRGCSHLTLTYSPRMGRGLALGILIGWGVNIVALLVVDWLFDSVEIGRWGSPLLGAGVVGRAGAGYLLFSAQRRDARARRVDRARLLDQRLLDVRRRDDRGVARQLGAVH